MTGWRASVAVNMSTRAFIAPGLASLTTLTQEDRSFTTNLRYIYWLSVKRHYLIRSHKHRRNSSQHRGCLHPLHKSFTMKKHFTKKKEKKISQQFSLTSYYCISPIIKSQGVQNVPNRQLHATTKASKSFPDRSTLDQGEREARREETEAKIN